MNTGGRRHHRIHHHAAWDAVHVPPGGERAGPPHRHGLGMRAAEEVRRAAHGQAADRSEHSWPSRPRGRQRLVARSAHACRRGWPTSPACPRCRERRELPWPDYTKVFVGEGFVFELGGRQVEVIEIPAHASGSIALLDRQTKMLFAGDEIEAGQVLLFDYHTNDRAALDGHGRQAPGQHAETEGPAGGVRVYLPRAQWRPHRLFAHRRFHRARQGHPRRSASRWLRG